jgi:hypothetical protein
MLTSDRSGPLVIAMPHLAAERREHMTVAPGTTVAHMVAAALPGLAEHQRCQVRVTIGADVVPAELWARVRPKPAATVIIRVVPAGGSFRTILAIAVTVAAVALGQAYLTAADRRGLRGYGRHVCLCCRFGRCRPRRVGSGKPRL